jgi:hypothetical protein
METKKWFVRAGSLIILVGFFLPSVMVSCTITAEQKVSQPYSLADLAKDNTIGQGLLYLVPVLLLAMIAISFYSSFSQNNPTYVLWSQVGCLVASLLLLLLTAINLIVQVNKIYGLGGASGTTMQDLIQFSPSYGAFVLLIGYILAGFGLVWLFGKSPQTVSPYPNDPVWNVPPAPVQQDYAPWPVQPPYPPYPPQPVGAQIEVISGMAPGVFPLIGDSVMLGRSSECQIQISDTAVSRKHACLRFGQGNWFIQDQNSSAGTVVNGRPVNAIRLNSGDTITLGGVTLIFRS